MGVRHGAPRSEMGVRHVMGVMMGVRHDNMMGVRHDNDYNPAIYFFSFI
jgi:hypothetical protein